MTLHGLVCSILRFVSRREQMLHDARATAKPTDRRQLASLTIATVQTLAIVFLASSMAGANSSDAATISMRHVLTGARVNGYQGTQLSPATVAPYVSWAANPSYKNARAVQAAGMKVYGYTNPNRVYSCAGCSLMYKDVASNPNMQSKGCDGSPVTVGHGSGYLTDPTSPDVVKSFLRYIKRAQQAAGITWDAFFVDDFDTVLYTDNGKPCNFDKDRWVTASRNLVDAGGVPVIFNGLIQGPSELALVDDPNVIGAMYEGCYGFRNQFGIKGDGLTSGKEWVKTENIELAMARKQKLFWCFALNTQPTDQSRIYQFASFLLTYSPRNSLLQENYVMPSKLPVMPESQLVPMDPSKSAPPDVGSLTVDGGTYGREYSSCYLSGSLIGPCAIVVNSDNIASHPYPYGTKYSHSLRFQDSGGVMEGGVIKLDGPAPQASLGPTTAAIVFK